MSRFLLFSDLHCHSHKRSTERLNDCIECLEWVFDIAVEKKIENILFLGDLFHDRQKIDVLTYQKTFEVFEKYLANTEKLPFHVYLLLGNHDLWHLQKYDISSVNPLRNLPGVKVVDKPCTLLIDDTPISWLPYTHDPMNVVKSVLKDRLANYSITAPKVLCGHVAIDGAVWNTMHNTYSDITIEHDGDMVKVDSSIFSEWDHVFLGHYHAEQKLDFNCEYIGSPLQLSFGEAFQHKHILIFDSKTSEKEYIRNTFSPQHFIIPAEELGKYPVKGNFIRVMVDDLSAGDVIEVRRDLLEKNVGSVEIKQKPPVIQEQTEEIEISKTILLQTDVMLNKYLDAIDITGLVKDKLLEIGKKICEKP